MSSLSSQFRVKYLWQNRGVYYYRRAVPDDIVPLIGIKVRYVCLHTSKYNTAAAEVLHLTRQDSLEWERLREAASRPEVPLIPPSVVPQQQALDFTAPTTVSVSALDAKDLYLSLHKDPDAVRKMTELAFALFVKHCGDRPVVGYRRDDINRLVKAVLDTGVTTATVRRRLKSLGAAFAMTIREKELTIRNPFEKVLIPGEGKDKKRRLPLTDAQQAKLHAALDLTQDDINRIIGMLLDTGARLAEIVGLTRNDVILTAPVPHLRIQPHPWRRLKTEESNRLVPLVGSALTAAQLQMKATEGRLFFARYTDITECRATSASATINDRLEKLFPRTCHSLRHTMRDRLRAVECPDEITRQIMGWAKIDESEQYGRGFPLRVLAHWLQRA